MSSSPAHDAHVGSPIADDYGRAQRLAHLELTALVQSGTLGLERFGGSRITARGTVVHDTDGSVLFRRIPLSRGHRRVGYVDIGVEPALGQPLLTVSGAPWNERRVRAEARKAADRLGVESYDSLRFVAYSFPKLAVQFLRRDREVALLELGTWSQVPERGAHDEPGQFERWSLLATIPAAQREANRAEYAARVAAWENFEPEAAFHGVDAVRVAAAPAGPGHSVRDQRELQYSSRASDHHRCSELRVQEASEWCVAASVQMFLEFWRYEYEQNRIAAELGLGSAAAPQWLPDSRALDVVDVIEKLTMGGLRARFHPGPDWPLFRSEIRVNRPVVSAIPGHARLVVGYARVPAGPDNTPSRGLLVYDPLAVDPGSGPLWERFDAHRHKFAYTAELTTP